MPNVRENTMALIERYYAAFNAMDIDAILACLTDDVAHDINQGERETGRNAFRAFLGRMDHAYSEQLRDIVIMTSTDGARAAAEFMVHGVYKVADEGFPPAHGQSYVLPAGGFFDITDGKISRVSVYYNLTDWIAQVS
ncbi:ketosteroid isomerase-related protein [Sphingorhabdus sp. EL138]|uniref:ketosteroid isomerase-related protein n=1 Tax=Sphingorhabdus sp. EL138 TaxID=2073156 RepID=UPI0025E46A92|nr:ketosteroid isomerase-related protein [Sphingorhabdus sp. EL138]